MLSEFPQGFADAFIYGFCFIFLLGVWVEMVATIVAWLRKLLSLPGQE